MIVGTVALVMLLFMGGSGPLSGVLPKDFPNQMKQVIADPARSERAQAEWKGLQDDFKIFGKQLHGLSKQVVEVDDARTAGVAQLEPVIGGFEPARRAAQEKVLDRMLAIRKDITREEWAKLFGEPAVTGAK